jgi:hypothetical protein
MDRILAQTYEWHTDKGGAGLCMRNVMSIQQAGDKSLGKGLTATKVL